MKIELNKLIHPRVRIPIRRIGQRQSQKKGWSSLEWVAALFVFLVLLSLSREAVSAVETETPGEYTVLDANQHLSQILAELPVYDPTTKTFTPHRPPSLTLKQEVTNLEAEWQKLYDNSDLHDVPPPGRAKVLQRCDDLKNHLTGPTTTKHTLEVQLLKLEQRERFVDSSRKQLELRNWQVFVGAMANLGKEAFNSFKKISSPSPKDVQKLYEAILKKMVNSARKPTIQDPGSTATSSASDINLGKDGNKYFVERESEIIKKVDDYLKNRKFTDQELRNPDQIKSEIFILIRDYLRSLAVTERDGLRNQIQQIKVELQKYTHIALSPGSSDFNQYEALCKRIRDLKDWKIRTMVGLRIDPPTVQIEVGETTKLFKAIGKYSSGKGREVYVTNKVIWPDGNSFTGTKPGKFTIKAEFYGSLTATADITVVPSTKPVPPGPKPTAKCPAGKIEVPYIIRMKKNDAEGLINRLGLRFTNLGQEQSPHFKPGEVIEQVPYAGDCVNSHTEVRVKIALEVPETPALPFSAEFTCGSSFELSPNEVLYPKTCYVRASNFQTTRDRVEVEVEYDRKMVEVTFDKQSEAPRVPYNEFLLIFRTKTTAPPGTTPVSIIVKHGSETVRIPVTVAVLPPGREPSSGSGIRPPVEEATGSGGAYCVWRYKSFGDPPNCFNIFRAQCDNPKYSGKPKYELVGSAMTPEESMALASQLSPYKGDAYGCHRKPPEHQDTAGGPTPGETSGSGEGTGTDRNAGAGKGSGTGAEPVNGEREGSDEGSKTEEAQNTEDEQGTGEEQDEEDLLAGFPEDPGDAPPEGEPLTPEQEQAVEGFSDSDPTSHLPPTDPDQMVSQNSDDTPPVDIAAVAQAERDKEETRNREREGIQREDEGKDEEDLQTTNRQNEEDRQTQETASQDRVRQSQEQGQVLIDQATQNADPILSGQDMAEAVDRIQTEGEKEKQRIDERIRQGLGRTGQGGTSTTQPLPPPPAMGTGPVDTAVVQCNTKYGSGGDNPGFFTIDFNGAYGVAQFEYDTASIKDEMEVSAGGATFNTTCRSNGEKVPITIPSPNTPVTVTVKPNCACKKPKCTGTIWSFTFYCPTSAGAPTSGPPQSGNPQGSLLGQ